VKPIGPKTVWSRTSDMIVVGNQVY
jgi:hypothetical protein